MADANDSHDKSVKKDHGLTESAYLEREVERAKAAMARALDDAKKDLLHGLDPRAWTSAHPWYALTGAAVAGFLAASALTPSKREQALKRIAELNKALAGIAPDEEPPVTPAVADEKGHVYRAGVVPDDGIDRKSGILGAIGSQLIRSVGPAIVSAVTAAISANAAEDNSHDRNGRPPADDPARDPPDDAADYGNPT
jgi:hypothetical protein